MVARGDLGTEFPIEEVPILQEDIIRRCHSMHKPVIVATNMLESMISHLTPIRAEVSDIAISVREGADAIIMLSGETAHGKHPLKAIRVMQSVALRTESSLPVNTTSPNHGAYKGHMGEMFVFSCHNYGQHSQYTRHCLHKNWIHGCACKSLLAFFNNLCFHKGASPEVSTP